MKKILLASVLGLSIASAGLVEEAAKLDVKTVCNVKANGAAKVLAAAQKFNPEAVKLGVEFKRLGIKNRLYVKAVEEAVKAKSKDVVIKYKDKHKKDKTKKFTLEYAAERTCSFAIRALQLHKNAEKTWRLAVPGDGYKY